MQAAAMPMGKVVVRCDHATCTVHTPEALASGSNITRLLVEAGALSFLTEGTGIEKTAS